MASSDYITGALGIMGIVVLGTIYVTFLGPGTPAYELRRAHKNVAKLRGKAESFISDHFSTQ